MHATLHTSRGPIRLILEIERTPHTVANFVTLAKSWFYDGLNFHRVIEDFMIQWWCPQKTGTGWPGYRFGDEIHPELRHTWPGILSMANAGPGTNGSQFFITHVDTPRLDGKHTVFGRVFDQVDLDVVNSIQQDDDIQRVEVSEDLVLPPEVQEFVDMINKAVGSVER